MNDQFTQKKSELTKLQSVLGYDIDPAFSTNEIANVYKQVNSLPLRVLPPLNPQPFSWNLNHKFKIAISFGFSFVALFFLFIDRSNIETEFRPKGRSAVWLFIERGELVTKWHSGYKIEAKDRILSEVLAIQDSVAFWGVKDGNEALISGVDEFISSQIQIQAGQRNSFRGSFQMTGINEHETLMVLTCPKKDIENTKARILEYLMENQMKLGSWGKTADKCSMAEFRLR